MQDKIYHPDHYTWLREVAGVEVIDITRHMNFNLGNVIKYVLRAGHKHEEGVDDKDKNIEDLKKARWHLDDETRRLCGFAGDVRIPTPLDLKDEREDDEAPRPHTGEEENIHNGHEYVDLGLSALWATCNIGAEKPEDYGDYFAWGRDRDEGTLRRGQLRDMGGGDRRHRRHRP